MGDQYYMAETHRGEWWVRSPLSACSTGVFPSLPFASSPDYCFPLISRSSSCVFFWQDDNQLSDDCAEPYTQVFHFFASKAVSVRPSPTYPGFSYSTPAIPYTTWVTLTTNSPGPLPIHPTSSSTQNVSSSDMFSSMLGSTRVGTGLHFS